MCTYYQRFQLITSCMRAIPTESTTVLSDTVQIHENSCAMLAKDVETQTQQTSSHNRFENSFKRDIKPATLA